MQPVLNFVHNVVKYHVTKSFYSRYNSNLPIRFTIPVFRCIGWQFITLIINHKEIVLDILWVYGAKSDLYGSTSSQPKASLYQCNVTEHRKDPKSSCVDFNSKHRANRFVMYLMCRETAEVKLQFNMTADCINWYKIAIILSDTRETRE